MFFVHIHICFVILPSKFFHVNFGKYIHQLLLENDIVIVPGFGAFVSEYKPAEIPEDGVEIKPPSKIVTFNEQIRNNDGLLVGNVAEKQRITHFEALKRIEREREDILYKLDSGEQVELTNVGVLFHNEENKIGFTAVEDANLLLDSFGLESTVIEGVDEVVEDEVSESLEPSNLEEEELKEQEPEIETLEQTTTLELGEEPEVDEIIEEEQIPTPVAEVEPDPEMKDVPELKVRMAEPEQDEQKKKRAWWWLLLVLVPLIAVSVFIFTKGEKDKGTDNQPERESEIKISEQPEVLPSDTVKTESMVKDTVEQIVQDTVPVEQNEAKSEVSDDLGSPKYYLVGGSFSVEQNAEDYIKELKGKGYEAFHVGKKGRFFIVGIGTYDSFAEADQAKQEYMNNNAGSEVWVWKK